MASTTPKRIGILGGTFNPIHLGHLILAQNALEGFDLERVIFVPCAIPPHKPRSTQLADAVHRLAMAQLAAEEDVALEVCDVEVRRGGISYTIDTLWQLQRMYPGASLTLVIGADALLELHQWKGVEQILRQCTVAAFARPGFDLRTLRPEDLNLPPPWPDRLLQNVSVGRLIDISSSDIRHRVLEGMSIRYLVPREVEIYITEHRLYRESGPSLG